MLFRSNASHKLSCQALRARCTATACHRTACTEVPLGHYLSPQEAPHSVSVGPSIRIEISKFHRGAFYSYPQIDELHQVLLSTKIVPPKKRVNELSSRLFHQIRLETLNPINFREESKICPDHRELNSFYRQTDKTLALDQ